MLIVMGVDTKGSNLILWDYQRSMGDNRHHLLVIRNPSDDSRAYLPHMFVTDGDRSEVAGEIVLKWMRESSRTDMELRAARSFFGWDINELSANQLQFIADADTQGVPVDLEFVPPRSFDCTCPAVCIKDSDSLEFQTQAVVGTDWRDNKLIVFARN